MAPYSLYEVNRESPGKPSNTVIYTLDRQLIFSCKQPLKSMWDLRALSLYLSAGLHENY